MSALQFLIEKEVGASAATQAMDELLYEVAVTIATSEDHAFANPAQKLHLIQLLRNAIATDYDIPVYRPCR